MEIEVDTHELVAMSSRYGNIGPLVAREIKASMLKATLAVERSAKQVVPKDTGNLRRSLTHEVTASGAFVVGKVGSNVPYAKVVEEGRTPGKMPPEGALLAWMGRKGIPQEREFIIRRAINSRKTPRPYLKPAITANAAAINREFAGVQKRVLARLVTG